MSPRRPHRSVADRTGRGAGRDAGGLARRAGRLTAREWAALLEAQRALLAAEWLVRTRPTGDLLERAASGARWSGAERPSRSSADGEMPPSPLDRETARQGWEAAVAIHRAARYGLFRPRCLTRSIALQRLLARRGVTAEIRVGVRRSGGSLVAHAWVEVHGEVLGDERRHVREYTPLADFRVTP